MKCGFCGASVLKKDIACPKCLTRLKNVNDRYDYSKQYRSRFVLIFRSLLRNHKAWLGYGPKSNMSEIKEENTKDVISGVLTGMSGFSPLSIIYFITGFFGILANSFETVLIIFGKYQYDAEGRPVRYFCPKKEYKSTKLTDFDLSKVNLTKLTGVTNPDIKDISNNFRFNTGLVINKHSDGPLPIINPNLNSEENSKYELEESVLHKKSYRNISEQFGKVRKFSFSHIFCNSKNSVVIISFIMLLCAFYAQYYFFYSPERVINNYITALNSKRYNDLYEYIDFAESKFITKDQLEKSIVWYKDKLNNDSKSIYKISERGILELDSSIKKEDKKLLLFDVKCRLKEPNSSKDIIFPIKLRKIDGAVLGLLPQYKIVDEELHGMVVFTVSKYSKIYLNDVEIESTGEDSGYAKFVVPDMLIGVHTLRVEHPLLNTYREDFVLENTKGGVDRTFSSAPSCSVNLNNLYSNATEQLLNQLLKSVLNDKSVEDVGLICYDKDNFQKMYTLFTKSLKKNNMNLINNIEVKDGIVEDLVIKKDHSVYGRYRFNGLYNRINKDNTVNTKPERYEGYIVLDTILDKDKLVVLRILDYNLKFYRTL